MTYIIFLIIFGFCILYILLEDLETKYIPLIAFYPFVIFSIIYYYIEYKSLVWAWILLVYLWTILYLDIYESIKWEIASIWKKWSFLDTWIYDYFLYIFIWVLFTSEVIKNFWNLEMFIILMRPFISSLIIGTIFLLMHQKKVALLIKKNNLEDYNKLDSMLYNRNSQKIWYIETYKNKDIFWSEKEEDLFFEYKNRVPLYLYGWVFIISYIATKLFFN